MEGYSWNEQFRGGKTYLIMYLYQLLNEPMHGSCYVSIQASEFMDTSLPNCATISAGGNVLLI